MDRRTLLETFVLGLAGAHLPLFATAASAQDSSKPFSFDSVIALAREAAGKPYNRPMMKLTEPFADLKYDQYRAIRFRDDKRLFQGAGFQAELLPPGFSYQDKIEINVVTGGKVEPVAFSTDFFAFHPNYFPYPDGRAPAGLGADMGFSGVRFRHPVNRPGVWDEFAVFQGASYFRAVARDTLYGLSARGLAIGSGGSEPEEFPVFTRFWIEQPAPEDRVLRFSALLDSDSVTGAYDFSIEPGRETVTQLRVVLFPRRDIASIGIAPLTSMYFFGPESRTGIDDFRNAVHDSDGLRMVNGSGERLWRPLRNPPGIETSAFSDENPRSFGLIQRARNFSDYEDAETHYEQRPSAWVEPGEGWGKGAVMLVEIPSGDEFADNIVAFWRPETPLKEGSQVELSYRLTWGLVQEEELPFATVAATRSGISILDTRERVFAVDFDLGEITFSGVTPRIEVTAGQIKGLSVIELPAPGIVRVGFHFLPGEAKSAEFRLWLESEGVKASEIWLYRWSV
jgi:glucans biosynthesis protein